MRRLQLVLVMALVAAACGGGASVAELGDSVSVHYVGTLDDGSVFDSSRERDQTFDFVIGAGEVIAGFDAGVRGMKVGDIKTVRIEPAEAYGESDPGLIETVDISLLPEDVKVGDSLVTGTGQQVVVVELTEDSATIDRNGPLAGQALTFELEMVAINP